MDLGEVIMLASEIYIEGLGIIQISMFFDRALNNQRKIEIYTPLVNNFKVEAFNEAKRIMEREE